MSARLGQRTFGQQDVETMMEEFASKQEKKMHAALAAHGEALVQTFLTKALPLFQQASIGAAPSAAQASAAPTAAALPTAAAVPVPLSLPVTEKAKANLMTAGASTGLQPQCRVVGCTWPALGIHPFCSRTCANKAQAQQDDIEVEERMQLHRRQQVAQAQQGFAQDEFKRQAGPSADLRAGAARLGARTLPPDQDARLRGGAQRLPSRQAAIDRLQVGSGNITVAERDDLIELLTDGHQVPPHASSGSPPYASPPGSFAHTPATHPLSNLGVGLAMRNVQAAPELFQHLQAHSLAPPGLGEEALLAVNKMLKLQGSKEAQKASKVDSYKDFVEFFRKARVCTRDMHANDPDSFWSMLWHFQSVTFLFTNYGWPVAGKYHSATMEQWQEGRLHPQSFTESEEGRSGDIEGALHQRNFTKAISGRAPLGDKKAWTGTSTGSKVQEESDWTWCNHCKEYFPPSSSHKTSTCRKKAAADKKKGG